MKILVADDNTTTRTLLGTTLKKWGFETAVASDGDEAWSLIQAPDTPRMVLLDWTMPGLSGIEICTRLRESSLMPIPYVILLTAKAGTADIVTGLNAGANDYIFKPFILEELRARIGVGQRYLDLQDALARRVAELNDLNRVYAVLSNVNQAIIRVQDRQDLFSEVCRIAVEDGRFRMAWIGWLDQELRSLVIKCHHGYSDGYLELLRIDVDSGPFSRGPAGVALKEGTYHVCNDVAHDEEMAPWREEALKREFMSVAAFPVRVDGRVAGVFTLYAGESGFFDGQRIRLLAELAADISFALEGMERERQRQEAEKALHALNLQLEQRVLERTSELESVNRELEAFGYSVSHDLRAPLRHISGFSEVFWDEFGDVLGGTGKAFLEKIQDACRQMTRLIDDLLELSRASRKEMDCHTVDVTALCHDVAHGLIHGEPQRSVTVNIAPGMTVRADRGLLRIVLHNLIDNAWKYTARKDHATIEVGIIDSGGEWVFYVRDDGVGFNMDYTEKIFDAFQRLHSNDEFPGTGIGLATVHRIVSRHGGRVWAEGQPGKGATFYFTIPS